MKKFLVIYHSPVSARAQMAEASPEQQQAGIDAWMSWANKVGDRLVDLGAPLGTAEQVGYNGKGGSGNANVGGYSILLANDINEAKSLLEGHPHIGEWNPEATIELHEAMEIPGMN